MAVDIVKKSLAGLPSPGRYLAVLEVGLAAVRPTSTGMSNVYTCPGTIDPPVLVQSSVAPPDRTHVHKLAAAPPLSVPEARIPRTPGEPRVMPTGSTS